MTKIIGQLTIILSMLLVSAQLDDLSCGPVCPVGTYCRLGQCIPLPPLPPSALNPAVLPPPNVPAAVVPMVGMSALPGMGQFGAPCPRGTRFINNQCIVTGQSSQKQTYFSLGMVLLIGVF